MALVQTSSIPQLAYKKPDYHHAIAEDRLEGYSVFNKFAFNTAIGTGALKILSSDLNIVQPLTAGQQLSFKSASDEDKEGGTGITKLGIDYWDDEWSFLTEVVSLDGINAVNTNAENINRIADIYRVSAGSGSTADGKITISNVPADAVVYAEISQYRAKFERCLHYVAPGKMGIITSINSTARTSGGVTFILIRDEDYSSIGGSPRIPIGITEIENSSGGGGGFYLDPHIIIDNRNSTRGKAIAVTVAATSSPGQDGSATMSGYEFTPTY